ncbi:MAG TPA: hypothetical protein VLG12_06440 [Candidatus Saccharimonadales bacterium]|nr:hypothetical protein [Candidatus Saccharimonadales bacterium]
MKKFVLLYVGSVEPTQEVMEGWQKWFGVLGNRVVDSGNPFGAGREITKTGTHDLAQDEKAISGYTIINAESMEEVENLSKECPIVTSVKIYEAMAM